MTLLKVTCNNFFEKCCPTRGETCNASSRHDMSFLDKQLWGDYEYSQLLVVYLGQFVKKYTIWGKIFETERYVQVVLTCKMQ